MYERHGLVQYVGVRFSGELELIHSWNGLEAFFKGGVEPEPQHQGFFSGPIRNMTFSECVATYAAIYELSYTAAFLDTREKDNILYFERKARVDKQIKTQKVRVMLSTHYGCRSLKILEKQGFSCAEDGYGWLTCHGSFPTLSFTGASVKVHLAYPLPLDIPPLFISSRTISVSELPCAPDHKTFSSHWFPSKLPHPDNAAFYRPDLFGRSPIRLADVPQYPDPVTTTTEAQKLTDAQWRSLLGPHRYHITRSPHATIRPKTRIPHDEKAATLICASCSHTIANPGYWGRRDFTQYSNIHFVDYDLVILPTPRLRTAPHLRTEGHAYCPACQAFLGPVSYPMDFKEGSKNGRKLFFVPAYGAVSAREDTSEVWGYE